MRRTRSRVGTNSPPSASRGEAMQRAQSERVAPVSTRPSPPSTTPTTGSAGVPTLVDGNRSYVYPYTVELDLIALEMRRGRTTLAPNAKHPPLVPLLNQRDRSVAFAVATTPTCTLTSCTGRPLYSLCHKGNKAWPRYVVEARSGSVLFTLRYRARTRSVEIFHGDRKSSAMKGSKGKMPAMIAFHEIVRDNVSCMTFCAGDASRVLGKLTRALAPENGRTIALGMRVESGVDAALLLSVALTLLGEKFPRKKSPVFGLPAVNSLLVPVTAVF